MAKIEKALFGGISLYRAYCPRCKGKAFIIDEKYSCCDEKYEENITDFKKKRVSSGRLFRPNLSKTEKQKLIDMQGGRCIYCETSVFSGYYSKKNNKWINGVPNVDHFTPWSFDGNHTKNNLVITCRLCNMIKGNLFFKTFEEAQVYILNEKENYGTDNEVSGAKDDEY